MKELMATPIQWHVKNILETNIWRLSLQKLYSKFWEHRKHTFAHVCFMGIFLTQTHSHTPIMSLNSEVGRNLRDNVIPFDLELPLWDLWQVLSLHLLEQFCVQTACVLVRQLDLLDKLLLHHLQCPLQDLPLADSPRPLCCRPPGWGLGPHGCQPLDQPPLESQDPTGPWETCRAVWGLACLQGGWLGSRTAPQRSRVAHL